MLYTGILDKHLLNSLFKLYSDYRHTRVLSASEYITQIEQKTKLSHEEISIFLDITKHAGFLQNLAEHFLETNFLKYVNSINVEVILFLLIFMLDEENLDILLERCLEMKCFYLCELIAAIVPDNKQLVVCQIACKYFDNEYVLEQIIDPFLNKIPNIIKLGRDYLQCHEIKPLPVPKIKEFSFLKRFHKKKIFPPSNTPAISFKFRASVVPKSTYRSKSRENQILKLKEENRKKAERLILQASQVPERLLKGRTTKQPELDERKVERFKRKPIPSFKTVEIKGNITTTLREASRVIKNQEEEVKKIDYLIKGGFNKDDMDQLEEQLRKEHELKQLEIIEKNHLKGLLSREEAILAKRKLLEANKQKMEQFKEEKIELLQILEQCREEQEQKTRLLVEKSQAIKHNAKKSERRLLERRQRDVQIQQQETREMLSEASAEKYKELRRKIDLIQEIKAIHQVRCDIKEFDPTETPNLGLLCEMSIAELQERLALTKRQMQKELEEKRQAILKTKEQHRLMIENVKKLICENRIKKPKMPPKEVLVVEENSELMALRKQLEEKRRLRNSFQ